MSTQPLPVLTPTMEKILADRPRFRILVVGKTGVGKSSLINAVFNVDAAHVSHGTRGITSINDEILSPTNERVVVHDSKGVEPGEITNLATLTKFIQDRLVASNQADRVDCVWLCIKTPTAGDRVLETGTEKIMQILTETSTPFVVIFTQYDKLVNVKENELLDDEEAPWSGDEDNFSGEARRLAWKDFETNCCKILIGWAKANLGHEPPIVNVSTKSPYHETLVELMQKTTANLPQDTRGSSDSMDVGKTARVRFATAQNVDAHTKMDASIMVGKREYWRGLASSTHFPGLRLDACLRVLHRDIVSIWYLKGMDGYLDSPSFERHITQIVAEDKTETLLKVKTVSLLGMAGVISGVASAASGPAAPIVGPTVFAGLVIATWIYNTYQSTPDTLRRLMRYIIDLTNVMYDIFVDSSPGQDLQDKSKQELAEAVVRSYMDSPMMKKVHGDIEGFVKETKVWKAADKDYVLLMIERILRECTKIRNESAGVLVSASAEVAQGQHV